jgi:hypothetical protein
LATGTTNEFNALCNLSPAMMLRLEILAFQGPSPVSNAFTQEADRLGLTPTGRERIEREERRKFTERMEALRQQIAEFRKTLDLLEQATAEALRENDEQLRAAREELRRVRDRAYEITMPDGTVARVYRDGDKVRADDGAEVSPDIVRAEDIGNGHSTWAEHVEVEKRVGELGTRREALEAYRRRVQDAKGIAMGDDVTADELSQLERNLREGVPAEVARHFNSSHAAQPAPAVEADASANGLAKPFAKAVSPSALVLTDSDFEIKPSATVSTPVPR